MADKEREKVISNLRACLLSTKGGIPTTNLERDYRMLEGSRIPYQKLGYQTLEAFLKSIPNVSISRGRNGEMILDAIPTKNTEHLADLVSKQRSAPKKHSTRYMLPRRTAASSWRPPPSAMSMKSFRRPVSPRMPLSVTVSNHFDNSRGVSFEKPSRMVSFSNTSSQSGANSSGGGGRTSYHNTFEKPPRFLRMEQKENVATSPPEVAAVTVSSAVQVPNSVKAPVRVSSPTEESKPTFAKAQSRLQHIASAQSAKKSLEDDKESQQVGIPNAGIRTIISPLTPLQARLSAAVNKPQVQAMQPLEEKIAAASLGGGEDHIKVLEEFCASRKMSTPTFKVMPRMSEGRAMYSCSVKIDEFRFSCYPDERPSPGEAMQLAAKQALNELKKISCTVGGSATQDENTIMSRISHIVGQHRHGIWSTQIPIDYNNKYSEKLPDDWLKIMHRCPLVTLEHAAGNKIILTPSWPSEPTSPAAAHTFNTNPMDFCHGKATLKPIGMAIPEPITLPQDDVWDVYVTCGNSTNEIWCRLIGEEYSVKYDNLATDMEMFYMGKSNVAANPQPSLFYAIKVDDCWHRVELLEITENGTHGRVFFIDHGDEEEVELKELHVLERVFARLPAQAVLCYLWGLEEFSDDPNAAHHITDTIVGKTLIASIKSWPRPDNKKVGVNLFDTSTDEDLNMNTVLIERISKEAMAPQLPPEGHAQEVYVSHVTNSGDMYLQFDSYNYLHSLVTNVIETGLKENHITKGAYNSSSDPNQLYLARYHLDGSWYRAAITKRLDGQKEVQVLFVDFGNTEVINPSDLIVLEAVNKSLANFPHQAIKVRLQNVPETLFNEKVAQRLRELCPCEERVLVKTVSTGRSASSVPIVEIFKRIQPDNLLVSVSDTLKFDPELSSSMKSDENSNRRNKKHLERKLSHDSMVSSILHSHSSSDPTYETSFRGLSPPQIPDIGDYFDVHVTMAANPGNFTVQPYKNLKLLEKLMEEMQAHYKSQKYAHPTAETVHEGGLYAAFHNDGNWYRVYVSNVINGNMVSVYFCDYGDMTVLTLDKLQPLTNQFKELSYQAIKAKLAGVQPKHNDWSVEDCLMFQELVVENQFVSVIMETGPDLLNPSDTVIGLKLIDTSGDEDVYIDKLLIQQDRAIATSVP